MPQLNLEIITTAFICRKKQHQLWLEREALAQEQFRKKKEEEERRAKEKLDQEVMLIRCLLHVG